MKPWTNALLRGLHNGNPSSSSGRKLPPNPRVYSILPLSHISNNRSTTTTLSYENPFRPSLLLSSTYSTASVAPSGVPKSFLRRFPRTTELLKSNTIMKESEVIALLQKYQYMFGVLRSEDALVHKVYICSNRRESLSAARLYNRENRFYNDN